MPHITTLAAAGALLISSIGGCTETYMDTYRAKSAVRDRLIDPDSAQFRNLHWVRDWSLCGEVNAKNRYGGYTGYKPFYVVIISHEVYRVWMAGNDEEVNEIHLKSFCPPEQETSV